MIGPLSPEADRMDDAATLIEQLIWALELREVADPDSPAWAAEREVRRLEREIMTCARDIAWVGIGSVDRRHQVTSVTG
jgi:hypothetical protein